MQKASVYEMFYFELTTGPRRGELFGLKWSDIDFQAGASRIQRQVQRLLGSCEMEKIRSHDLRHTFATLALQNGVDVKALSAGYLRSHLHPDAAGCGQNISGFLRMNM